MQSQRTRTSPFPNLIFRFFGNHSKSKPFETNRSSIIEPHRAPSPLSLSAGRAMQGEEGQLPPGDGQVQQRSNSKAPNHRPHIMQQLITVKTVAFWTGTMELFLLL